MYLTGEKSVKLDAKARLTLPADFRKEFDTQIRMIPMNDALYGFTPEGFAEWMNGLFNEEYRNSHPNHARKRRQMNARTVMLDIDNAGRIALSKIPAEKRELLGISGEVVVVGNENRFEIWNSAAWAAENAEDDDDDFADLMGQAGF